MKLFSVYIVKLKICTVRLKFVSSLKSVKIPRIRTRYCRSVGGQKNNYVPKTKLFRWKKFILKSDAKCI